MLKDFFKTNIEKGKVTYWIMMVVMVVLPLYYWYLPPFIILLGIFWMLQNRKHFFELFTERTHERTLLLLFVLLFFWQSAGILYSSDLKMALSNIFGRLSFVAFPLILFNPDNKIRSDINILLKVFSVSTLVYIISCFAYAFFRSISFLDGHFIFNPYLPEYDWQSYFFGSDFTYSIHPSYLAMFVLLSAFISFESATSKSIKVFIRILWFFGGTLLLVSLYFISSRAAIIAGVLLCMLYAASKIYNKKAKSIYWIGAIIVLLSLLPIISRNDRVKYFLDDLANYSSNSDEGLKDDRIITWKTSFKIISNNLLLGVGVGDVRNELVKEYNTINAEDHINQRLNAHNQFIEVFLENGIIGFILFSGIFFYMIYLAIAGKNLLYGLFILMMFIFFMFETVLYRLAGVAFFSIFAFLLLHVNPEKANQSS